LALEMEQALSRMDFLTRLANRKSFLEELDTLLVALRAAPQTLVVLSVNLDRFAAFNQEQGYTVGDLALGAVADAMRRAARKTDLLGRTDNSEFSIARQQSGVAGTGSAEASLKSLQSQLELLLLARGWPLTFSVACASFAAPPESAHAVMGKARILLEEAKQSGRNRSVSRSWDAHGAVIGAPPNHVGPYMDFEQTTQMYVEPDR
jgi:diguanylate cyclase (GGDEF)-like protein